MKLKTMDGYHLLSITIENEFLKMLLAGLREAYFRQFA
jgi:hypothetical protein